MLGVRKRCGYIVLLVIVFMKINNLNKKKNITFTNNSYADFITIILLELTRSCSSYVIGVCVSCPSV